MKVLILANFDVGLYRFRGELIKTLLRQHQVVISLPDGDMVRPLEEMGCTFVDTPVDRRGINPVTDFWLFLNYLKLLRREKPDLVITYTIKPNIYGGLACRLLGVPYAGNITGLGSAFQKQGLLRKLVTALYKLSLKKAKVVFFENRGNLQTILDAGIITEDRCKCLNGAGVDLEQFAFASYPEDEDPIRFLFVGRIMAEKGVNELFSAMERLVSDGVSCELHMLGGYEENYKQTIAQYEQRGWLKYHGFQPDVKPFIASSHCFVLPSWHEGMANTNLECAAMGRPLITSNIHGCKEAVLDGVSGMLCEAQNTDSLYNAMKRFLALSQDDRRKMGQAGRKHMEDVFDKKIVVAETLAGLGL